MVQTQNGRGFHEQDSTGRAVTFLKIQGSAESNPITFYLSVITMQDLLCKHKIYGIIKHSFIDLRIHRVNVIMWAKCTIRNITICYH